MEEEHAVLQRERTEKGPIWKQNTGVRTPACVSLLPVCRCCPHKGSQSGGEAPVAQDGVCCD